MIKVDEEVLKEIDAMNEGDFPPAKEEEKKEETAPKEEEKDEEVKDDPPEDEEEKDEEPDEKEDEEPSDEEEDDEDEQVEEEEDEDEEDALESIRAELEKSLEAKKPVEEKPSEKSDDKDEEIEEVDFLADLGMEEDELTPAHINKLLNKVYKKGKEEATTKPEVDVQAEIQRNMQMMEVNRDFYQRHPELAKYKNFVGQVSKEVIENLKPEDKEKLTLGEVFELTADEAKKRLRIKAKKLKEEREEKEKKDKPNFPKVKGKRKSKSKPKLSPMEKEIQEMIDLTR